MYVEQESIFYYITVMNENYAQPAMPAGVEAGHSQGRVPAADRRPRQGARHAVRLRHHPARVSGGGADPREGLRHPGRCATRSPASASCVARRWNASAGICCIRQRRARVPYVQQLLKDRDGPVIAATDYMRIVPDQIRQWVGGRYVTLGTDGYGRSDSRAALRRHFEVDRNYIAWRRSRRWPTKARSTAPPWARPSRRSASIPPSPSPGRSEGLQFMNAPWPPHRSARARHGRLQGRRRHRRAGQARRHHRSRHAAGHARDREGDHGRAVHGWRHHREGPRHQGRQGQHRRPRGHAACRHGARRRRPGGSCSRQQCRGASSSAAAPAREPTAARSAPAAPPPAQPAAAAAAPAGAVLTPLSRLGMPTSYRSDLAPIDEPGFSRAHAGPSVRSSPASWAWIWRW